MSHKVQCIRCHWWQGGIHFLASVYPLAVDWKNNINLINQFTEKPTIDLEYPEATGIYIFNNSFLDLLKLVSKENEEKSFDLSKDVLSKIDYYTKDRLYCYLLHINETNWVDIESPTYIERNKKTIEGIISQMESVRRNGSLLNKKPMDWTCSSICYIIF